MYSIDRKIKPNKVSLFLTTPSGSGRGKLSEAHSIQLNIKLGKINELSFTLPYKIEENNQLVDNPNIAKIKERFLIKFKYGKFTEWFVITKKNRSSNDSEQMRIECFSLSYEIKYKRIRNYEAISYNMTQVMTDCLKDTGWKLGYVNSDFDTNFRQFDISGQNKLDFLFDICETFNAIPFFDTENRVINMYKEEEISSNKGLRIAYGKYLESLDETIDIDEVCTRLHIYGSDDISIQSVNPSGQDYIDDFSYFLYPFERDENKNVIRSSDYMSDELCHTLLDYNEFLLKKQGTFDGYLSEKSRYQSLQTDLNNQLTDLTDELNIISDNIKVQQVEGSISPDLLLQRQAKQDEIGQLKLSIQQCEIELSDLDRLISELKDELKLENNFSEDLLEELNKYVFEQDWSDDNYIYESDLYIEGLSQLEKINTPPINLTLSIINFLEVIEEQHNWDKLNLGDIVTVLHDKLNIRIKTMINEIRYDFENGKISLTISNNKEVNSDKDKMMKLFQQSNKAAKEFIARKNTLINVAKNFNTRNDRISAIPQNPIIADNGTAITHEDNDDGSVNLTLSWTYPYYDETKEEKHSIDGFFLYFYSSNSSIEHVFIENDHENPPRAVEASSRKLTFPSVPANKYYSFAIQAYRSVDRDISETGHLKSAVVYSLNDFDTPYIPRERISINADLTGKVNGVRTTVSPTEPTNPELNDVWTDTTTNTTKVYNGEEFVDQKASDANTVQGLTPDVATTPNTIPVRNESGIIQGSISGDAQTLNGKSVNDFILNNTRGAASGVATLDGTGNVPKTQLGNGVKFATGSYTGDGTLSKTIAVGFTPTLIKVYTTSNADNSIYIPSTEGGFLMSINTTMFSLTGSELDTTLPTVKYGKLTTNGFSTGDTVDYFINKLNVKYYWEAVKS